MSGRRIAAALAIVAVAGWLAVPGLSRAQSQTAPTGGFRVPAPTRTVLKNGLTLLVLERRAIPLVEFRVLIKSGSAADPAGKEGAAALTARLLKRGTRTRSAQQFAQEVEFVGGTLESQAGPDSTTVRGEFASRDVEVGFNLLADMVLNPAFKEEELQREKRLVLADIVARLDDPEAVAQLAFASWLFGPHPYGKPVEGTKASLSALARTDVAGYYESRYAPNNAVLVIVGDLGAAQAAQKAGKYFGAWKRRAVTEVKVADPAPVRGRKVLLVDKPDATQSQIRFGNVGIRRNDPDYFNLAVANAVLGQGFTSWLVDEVRVKRGLTYYITSRVSALRGPASWSVITFSKNPTVLETIKVSLEQVQKLREGKVPPEDLDKARAFLAGRYPLSIEGPDDLADEILAVDFYGLGPDYINQYQKKVRAVGLEGVKRTAERYVPLDDLAIVVVGPAAEMKEPLATLGPVTVRPLEGALAP